MKPITVKATKVPKREAWRVQFKHWSDSKYRNVNLGSDEQFAHAVAAVLTTLSNETIFHQAASRVPALKLREFGYGTAAQRALTVYFPTAQDATVISEIFDTDRGLTSDDLGEVRKLIGEDNAAQIPDFETDHEGNTVPVGAPAPINPDVVAQILETYLPAKVRMLQDHCNNLEQKLQAAQSKLGEVAELQDEIRYLRKMLNQDVTATVGEAFDKWLKTYTAKRSGAQATEGEAVLLNFIETLPAKRNTPLKDVGRWHVREWLEELKGRDAKRSATISPVTKLHKYSFVRVFFRHCCEVYDKQRYTSPLAVPVTIDGAHKTGERLAIRRLADLTGFIEALKPKPYWRAFAAFACLAGPRLSEQCKMKIDDVRMDEGLIDIYATKTGEQRAVNIEITILKPILAEHIAHRRAQQKSAAATAAERSELLFPSNVPDGTIKRKLALVGRWSGTKAFNVAWKRDRLEITAALKAAQDPAAGAAYWKYGPREWRRTFGTALANAGFNALEISRAMGNSSEVAQKHYIGALDSGAPRWPLKFK